MSECKYSFSEAIIKIESWCAYQDRCTFEVEQKLTSWNISLEQQSEIIKHLLSNFFLDDKRFVESFVSGKFKLKRWGKIKIKHHLIQKRIDKVSIQEGLKSIDLDTYLETMKHLAQKKFLEKKAKDDVWAIRRRVSTYLASKGYESDLIHDVVGEVVK
jgi:regulatory protein